MEKGMLGGVLFIGLVNWGPFDQSWPILVSLKTAYAAVLDKVAMAFFMWQW